MNNRVWTQLALTLLLTVSLLSGCGAASKSEPMAPQDSMMNGGFGMEEEFLDGPMEEQILRRGRPLDEAHHLNL